MINKRTKRDINKELMFNKIMPSYLIGQEGEYYEDENTEANVPVPQNENVPGYTPQNPENNPVIQPDTDYPRYINITEQVLYKKLDGMITMFKACKCEQCRHAIIIQVLNNTKPYYVYKRPSEIEQMIATENYADIVQPIIRAILDTKTNPAHQK